MAATKKAQQVALTRARARLMEREAREARELQERLKREFLDRQIRRAA